ncbi:MAG: glycosyltransferase family 2 protein [Myxococcota bacterium]|jgi:dolichyl-phosphate beta-glucosyltransferase|nr:glycosyltransferase family 2 protein [Myxococcota bacterium]
MSQTSPTLSIIVPAYNEEARLGPTLSTLRAWMDEQAHEIDVLVVDDGSSDGTVALAESVAMEDDRIGVLQNGRNRGKGFSVGHGVSQATGDLVLFSDADLSTPLSEFARLEQAIVGHDIAIGSRALPDSRLEVRQPFYREMMGRTFNLFVQRLVFPGIHDTQCGFKLFRREAARATFERRKIDGFAFDVEILYVARRLGLQVAEVPVLWINDEASRVDPIRHSAQMFRDILKIRRLHRDLPS